MSKAEIYCDGSSIGNPGPGGWGAVVSYSEEIIELGGSETHTTNNRMEISAALFSLEKVPARVEVTLHTDSSYLINGISKWVHGWKRNGWKTSTKEPVLNQDLWEALLLVVEERKVSWKHVKGHSGILLNERVDDIANTFARAGTIELYSGPKEKYPHKESYTKLTGNGKSGKNSGKAYLYLSLVDGKVHKHKTWAECEKVVKGRSGVKFKKATSEADVANILKAWGV